MLEGRSGMLEGRCERPRASPLHACPTGPASLPRDTAGLLALARSQRPYGHPAFVPTERAMGEARRNAGGAPWPWNAGGALWNAGGALWECRRGAAMLEGRSGMLEGRCERPRASPLHACPTGPASLPRDTAGLLALARSQRPYGHPAFVPTERAMGEARRNAGGAPWPWNAGGALWNAGGALWECRRGAAMLEGRSGMLEGRCERPRASPLHACPTGPASLPRDTAGLLALARSQRPYGHPAFVPTERAMGEARRNAGGAPWPWNAGGALWNAGEVRRNAGGAPQCWRGALECCRGAASGREQARSTPAPPVRRPSRETRRACSRSRARSAPTVIRRSFRQRGRWERRAAMPEARLGPGMPEGRSGMPERCAVMLEARRNVGGALRAAASKPAPRLPHRSGVPPARHGGLARARALAAPLRSSGVRSDREGDGRGAPQCRRRALALECWRGAASGREQARSTPAPPVRRPSHETRRACSRSRARSAPTVIRRCRS